MKSWEAVLILLGAFAALYLYVQYQNAAQGIDSSLKDVFMGR